MYVGVGLINMRKAGRRGRHAPQSTPPKSTQTPLVTATKTQNRHGTLPKETLVHNKSDQ